MSRKVWIILAVIAVLIAGGGAAWYFLDGDSDDSAPAATTTKPGWTITDRDMTLGNRHAKVVLIEYAAPMCPHCARFNEDSFPKLKADYIDTGKVFYVFRVMPIGPADGPAETLARCQPKGKYFAFIDMLFRNQAKWDPEYGVQDVQGSLQKLSQDFGMSADAFNKCLADPKAADAINQVAEDGANRYGINSTPSIVIDGTLRPEMAEWPALKVELDKELAGK